LNGTTDPATLSVRGTHSALHYAYTNVYPVETIQYFYPEELEEFLQANPGFEDLVVRREIQVDELTRANDPSSDSASRNNTAPSSPVEAASHESDLIDLNASTEQFNIDANNAVVDLTCDDGDEQTKKKRGRGRPRSMSNTRPASNGSTPAATSSVNGHDSPPRNRKKRGPNTKNKAEELANRFNGTITDPKLLLEYVKQAPPNEVFASSHADSNYPSTLARKCIVEHVSRVPDNKVIEKQPSHYFYRKFFDQTSCELRDVEEHTKTGVTELARRSYKRVNIIYNRSGSQYSGRFTTAGETASDMDSDEILNTRQDGHAKSGPPLKRRKLDNKNRENGVEKEKGEKNEVLNGGGSEQQPNGNHNVNTTNTNRALKNYLSHERSESSEGEPVRTAVGPGRGRKRKLPELSNPEYMESLRIEYNNTSSNTTNNNTTNNTNVPAKQTVHTSTIDMILDDDYQGSSEVQMLERAVEKVHEAVDLSRHALEAFKKQITVRIRALEELS
jgi:hypothetical protein